MATLDIDDFDLTPYQFAPLLPAESTVTLAGDLYACKPAESTLQVEKKAKKMYEAASELKQVFITRVELAGINLRMRMMFDTVSDRFWVVTRQQILHWANYAHEGMDMLSDEEKAKIDHADKLDKAEVARELDKHLFSDGLKFLAKPFNQQVTLMASRLSFIAASNKFSAYQEIIGPDLLNTLNVLQGRYEAMVRERNTRGDDSAEVKGSATSCSAASPYTPTRCWPCSMKTTLSRSTWCSTPSGRWSTSACARAGPPRRATTATSPKARACPCPTTCSRTPPRPRPRTAKASERPTGHARASKRPRSYPSSSAFFVSAPDTPPRVHPIE